MAKDTYNWAEKSLIQVAKAKGGAAIAEWDRGNRLRGIIVNQLAGDNGIRAMLYKRFGPKYTSATAVNAASDIKQRSRESCAQFLDRVVLAVNKQNFIVGEADKQTEVYKVVFDAAIISHFGAGLRDDISKVVLGSADAPNTVAAMLNAAEAVEAEQAKVGAPGTSALAVQEEDHTADPLQDLTERFEELVAAIGFRGRKPFDKSKVRCYNCDKNGHFQNECPESRRTPRSTTTHSKPRTPARRPNKAKRRPQYAVQEEEEAPEEEFAEEYESEEEDSGNYQGRLTLAQFFIPAAIMSFWTVMSCCFTSPKPESRPCKVVTIHGNKVRALLDTGSSISLINSTLKPKLLNKGSNAARSPMVKLGGAGGKELTNSGCYSLQCLLGQKSYWHNFTFIDNLQVPCILGMDILLPKPTSPSTQDGRLSLLGALNRQRLLPVPLKWWYYNPTQRLN